jgi:O-antigen ligase
MKKSGWMLLPAAFFLLVNFSVSSVKSLFLFRLVYFLFLINLFLLLRKFNLKKILIPLVGGISFILFLFGIIQKYILFPRYLEELTQHDNIYSTVLLQRIESGRVFALFTLPSLYAIICAILILFITHYLIKTKKKVWFILLILGFLNLILTQSFGGIFLLFIGVLVYLFYSKIVNFKYLAPIIMVFFLVTSIIIALRFGEAKKMQPITLRISNWQQAVRVIKSSPVWGVGLGNYESRISYYIRDHEAKSIYAHNFFLQFIADAGILISCFLIIFLFFCRNKLIPVKVDGKDKCLYIAALLMLFFYNLIDIGIYFFSAGVATAIVLSQLYPKIGKKRFKVELVFLSVISLFLIMETVSNNYRKEADILMNQKFYSESKTNYQKSYKINPLNFRALIGYIYLSSVEGNKDMDSYLDEVLALYPDTAFGHHLKSKIEISRGHYLSAFFHASLSHQKEKLHLGYNQWYQKIKTNLDQRLKQVEH